ncbi:hypothetical protein HMPREF1475_00586 [Hoylesella oralis HGA0225]|nr:hypothetical protein HMPREF1475_00586 [Hoylesella oralis HGA0225]SHF78132.1 hypothetical protein SAMN05444288_1527 [Hoylesella oralis]
MEIKNKNMPLYFYFSVFFTLLLSYISIFISSWYSKVYICS